jgi:hypothetical protein
MASAERGRLIEKEEFRPRVRRHHGAAYAAEFERACYPTPALREAHDAAMIVV